MRSPLNFFNVPRASAAAQSSASMFVLIFTLCRSGSAQFIWNILCATAAAVWFADIREIPLEGFTRAQARDFQDGLTIFFLSSIEKAALQPPPQWHERNET